MRLQAGVSIVSLMISISISLLGFAATFSLFTNMSIIKSQQQQKHLLATNLTTLITKIEFDILNAGFDLDHQQTEAHLLVTEKNKKTQIQWRYFDSKSNKVICEGIEDLRVKINQIWWRQINSLQVSSDCNDSDALDSFTWSYSGNEITRAQQNLAIVRDVRINEQNCSPFNDYNTKQLQLLVINEQGEAEQKFERSISVCLINMPASS